MGSRLSGHGVLVTKRRRRCHGMNLPNELAFPHLHQPHCLSSCLDSHDPSLANVHEMLHEHFREFCSGVGL